VGWQALPLIIPMSGGRRGDRDLAGRFLGPRSGRRWHSGNISPWRDRAVLGKPLLMYLPGI
jgi:hypothetical protein